LAHRARQKSDLFPAIPSMIVQGQEGSSQFSVPRQEGSAPFALPRQEGSAPILVPPLPAGVLDLSSTVPADTWLLDPDTDLLGAHRRKTLRNLLIATAGIAVGGGAAGRGGAGGGRRGRGSGRRGAEADRRRAAVRHRGAGPVRLLRPRRH